MRRLFGRQLLCHEWRLPFGKVREFGLCCDAVTMWVVIIPAGAIAAFVLKLPVLMLYFWLNLDEFVKLPADFQDYLDTKDFCYGTHIEIGEDSYL